MTTLETYYNDPLTNQDTSEHIFQHQAQDKSQDTLDLNKCARDRFWSHFTCTHENEKIK